MYMYMYMYLWFTWNRFIGLNMWIKSTFHLICFGILSSPWQSSDILDMISVFLTVLRYTRFALAFNVEAIVFNMTDDDGNVLQQKNLSDSAFMEGKRMMLAGVRWNLVY